MLTKVSTAYSAVPSAETALNIACYIYKLHRDQGFYLKYSEEDACK